MKTNSPTQRGSHIRRTSKLAHLFWSAGRNILSAAESSRLFHDIIVGSDDVQRFYTPRFPQSNAPLMKFTDAEKRLRDVLFLRTEHFSDRSKFFLKRISIHARLLSCI